ncbi:MAG: cytidylate kinase-like family protein [Desulfobacterales bacterium]|nr:cytidylate kinase-like family protein [Desulfobacterales bacterium]
MAVITISRQFGAGGRTLGRMIADKLKYTFADNEVIEMIAEAANVSPMWVESVEKEAGTRLSRAINRLVARNLVDRVLKNERGYIDEKIYLDYLVVIISQIGEEGDVVILGRGSQYILNDHPDAYHILLIDEYENRVRFIMKHYDLPRNKAESVVRAEDHRRLSLYRRIGKEDYDSPGLYHLVLNMSRIDLDTALRIVLSMVESA